MNWLMYLNSYISHAQIYHYVHYCGQNPLEEIEQPSYATKEFEMQYLGSISKIAEWSLFISKANHSTSQ